MTSNVLRRKILLAIIASFFVAILLAQPAGAVYNFEDNNVDSEDDLDASPNIGSSDSFSSAQTIDAVNQEIQEVNTLEPEEDWKYYKRINIDKNKVEADLENFPILVSLYDTDLKNKAQIDGDDIAFFDDLDNQLAHEIESYNPNFNNTHAQLVAWVKSNLSSSVDTTLNESFSNFLTVRGCFD